jgi:hypothetical protein
MVPGHPWRVMATARWRAIVVMAIDVFAARWWLLVVARVQAGPPPVGADREVGRR